MQGAYRQTKMKDWFEFYRQTCPICHKSGGCIVHADGDRVACIRVQSNEQFGKAGLPSWLHYIKDGVKVDKTFAVEIENRAKLPDYILHQIYSSLLEHRETALTHDHLDHLLKERKLSRNAIRTKGYASFPNKPWLVAKDVLPEMLAKRLEDKNVKMGIPGFYKNQYGWSITGNKGILIPYRNEFNYITGLQVRVDQVKNDVEINAANFDGLFAQVKEQPNFVQILAEGEVIEERRLELNQKYEVKYEDRVGTVKLKKGQRYFWLSSVKKPYGTGAGDPIPIHIALPSVQLQKWNEEVKQMKDSVKSLKAESVWMTEGALKADIAVEHIANAYREELNTVGSTMIAVPGINTWRIVLPTLENMGVKRVNIAFDMDAVSKEEVKYFFMEMVKEMKKLGFEVYVALWNPVNKGIDDLLMRNLTPDLRKL